jgi:nickel/cobalt transporter (NicO) family protein
MRVCSRYHGSVNSTTPALLAAAAGVGLGHAILPDHWVPLAVVGRTERYPLTRVARLSLLAGVAHVLVSLLLGAIIIAVGLQFRSTIESAQSTIIGAVLILTGVGFATLELTGRRGHSHGNGNPHDDRHSHEPNCPHDHARSHRRAHDPAHLHSAAESDTLVATGESRVRGLAAIMVPFGAAASPDLTILPVFLAATAAGVFAAIGSLVVFSAVTIGTIVGLTLFACAGGYQVQGRWLDRWGNIFTAFVLLVIGALVFTSTV